MEKKTRHRHFWEFQRWINCPNNQKDITNRCRYDFLVEYRCSCGKIEKSEPSLEELNQYVADNSCSTCGEWGSASRHKGERDCITSLQNKVLNLEERLEKVCDALSGIGGRL